LPERKLVGDRCINEGGVGQDTGLEGLSLGRALGLALRGLGLLNSEVLRRQEICTGDLAVRELHLAAVVGQDKFVAELHLSVGRAKCGADGGERVTKMNGGRGVDFGRDICRRIRLRKVGDYGLRRGRRRRR